MIPELIDVGARRRVLPLGRYLASLDEVKECFVPDGDENRESIFDALVLVTSVFRKVFGSVCSIWIGGSFVTSEEHPNDVDVVFLVDSDCVVNAQASPMGRQFVSLLPIKHGVHPLVDTFILSVVPTGAVRTPQDRQYMDGRGYWDQFWSKTRFEDEADVRAAYPAAGYLEVLIDGFTC